MEVKQQVDDTLDMSKDVVAPVGHPDVGPNPGWGEDNVPAMFRPLLISPKVMLVQEDEELDLSDIDNLPPEVIVQIQTKARDRAALNMLRRLSELPMVCSAICINLLLILATVLVPLFGHLCVCMQSLTIIRGDW